MRVDIVSLFPDMIGALSRGGVVGRALERGVIRLKTWNPRDYAKGTYAATDDRPYGGGPGMVMMAEPTVKAIRAARAARGNRPAVVYMTPQGKPLTQATVNRLADSGDLIILCGRYEGIDERIVELEVDEECSLGDYVISGGELAAMVLADAIARQCGTVVGDADSVREDSFMTGLLDWPHYTRPPEYEGLSVPQALRSGDHEKIRRWRLGQSLLRTRNRRPDLFEKRRLSEEEQALLERCLRETKHDMEKKDE